MTAGALGILATALLECDHLFCTTMVDNFCRNNGTFYEGRADGCICANANH